MASERKAAPKHDISLIVLFLHFIQWKTPLCRKSQSVSSLEFWPLVYVQELSEEDRAGINCTCSHRRALSNFTCAIEHRVDIPCKQYYDTNELKSLMLPFMSLKSITILGFSISTRCWFVFTFFVLPLCSRFRLRKQAFIFVEHKKLNASSFALRWNPNQRINEG